MFHSIADSNNADPREGIKTVFSVPVDVDFSDHSNNADPREGIKTKTDLFAVRLRSGGFK